MSRGTSSLLPGLALAALVTAVVATAQPSVTPTKIFEIGNIAAVYNGVSAASIFTTTKEWTVVEVWTYHWNDAKGTTSPGTIGIKSLSAGKMYGPWRTTGSPGQGGVPNAYWHATVKVVLPVGRYKIVDSDPGTWSQNEGTGGRGMGWVMAIPAAGLAWPALPDALVSIESVSNGCGGGVASSAKRIGDTSTYLNSNNPLGTRYTVNFRAACNLHDAGYSGAKVKDTLNGGIVDHFTWTQKRVDDKFLADMQQLCVAQIPAAASVAISDCKGRGGKTSFGAETRYNLVTTAGSLFWRDRPAVQGVWLSDSNDPEAPRLVLTQSLRNVKGTWRSGSGEDLVKGEFRGTLISRDQDSIIKGFAKVTKGDTTVIRPMSITVDPDTPNVIAVGGPGLAGPMSRS